MTNPVNVRGQRTSYAVREVQLDVRFPPAVFEL